MACALASRCGRGVRRSLAAAAVATIATAPAWVIASGTTRTGAGTGAAGASTGAGAVAMAGDGISAGDDSEREPISAASATDAASAAPPPQRRRGRRAPDATAMTSDCCATMSSAAMSSTTSSAIARPTRREKSAGNARPAWPRMASPANCQRSQQSASSSSCSIRRSRNRASSVDSAPSIIAESCSRWNSRELASRAAWVSCNPVMGLDIGIVGGLKLISSWAVASSLRCHRAEFHDVRGIQRIARSRGSGASISGRNCTSMASRARKMRERTVPMGHFICCAISS